MAGLFGDLLEGGIGAAGVLQQIGATEDLGQFAYDEARALGREAVEGTTFKPFGVASSTGNVAVSPDGSLDATLSGPLSALSSSALSGASSLFGEAGMPIADRTAAIFADMQAALAPQQQRDRLGLESRLFSQGRLGIQSNLFGGAPEQLAMEKAIQEANLDALVRARGLAATEGTQAAQTGAALLEAGLSPEKTLFNQLNPAIQVANLGQTGQIAGQDLNNQTAVAGLDALLNSQLLSNDLTAGLFSTVGSLAGNTANQIGSGLFGSKSTGNLSKDLMSILF